MEHFQMALESLTTYKEDKEAKWNLIVVVIYMYASFFGLSDMGNVWGSLVCLS